MAVNTTFLTFWSGANYLKRDVSGGTATLALGGAGTTVTQTINHNLGYIPFFQVFCEQDASGKIWSPTLIDKFTESSLDTSPVYPALTSWATTSQLVININNNSSPVATGSRVIYWLIYKDYGNV